MCSIANWERCFMHSESIFISIDIWEWDLFLQCYLVFNIGFTSLVSDLTIDIKWFNIWRLVSNFHMYGFLFWVGMVEDVLGGGGPGMWLLDFSCCHWNGHHSFIRIPLIIDCLKFKYLGSANLCLHLFH